jgi:hypothetical protein
LYYEVQATVTSNGKCNAKSNGRWLLNYYCTLCARCILLFSLQQVPGTNKAQLTELVMLEDLEEQDTSFTVVVGSIFCNDWTVDAPVPMSDFFAGRDTNKVVPALREELPLW